MEILVRLGRLLSPSFFAILAGFSLVAAVALLFAGKRDAAASQVKSNKLSQVEPPEYRSSGYLVLAFGWSILGLVLGFIFAAINPGFSGSLLFVILSLLCLLFTLCFLYAGGDTMLSAVTGQRVRYINTLIMRFGDLLTAGLIRRSRYPGIVTEIAVPAKAVEKVATPAMSNAERKAAEEMKKLQHKLAEYETRLTPEQREKFTEARRIVEELRSMYP